MQLFVRTSTVSNQEVNRVVRILIHSSTVDPLHNVLPIGSKNSNFAQACNERCQDCRRQHAVGSSQDTCVLVKPGWCCAARGARFRLRMRSKVLESTASSDGFCGGPEGTRRPAPMRPVQKG